MKNVRRIKFGLMVQDLSLCLTNKAYTKEMKRLGAEDQKINIDGVCTRLVKPNMYNRYVIGVHIGTNSNILSIKALLVHELNHLVTNHMNEFNFSCDEYRASLLQFVYADTITFVDDFFLKMSRKKTLRSSNYEKNRSN